MNSNIFRSSLLKIRLTLFTLAIFLIVIWSLPSDAADRSPSRIVVLHSYHADFAWSDDIMKGIHKVFDKAGHNLSLIHI